MRALVHFFLLGAMLLATKRAVTPLVAARSPSTLTVLVKDTASAPELERAKDEAVLIEQALSHGGARIDPIVRDRLLQAMRAAGRERGAAASAPPEDDATLLADAIELGLPHADPIVRQRLAFQAEQLLLAQSASEPVRDGELARYHAAHPARYTAPARYSILQVFLSRSRHGERLASDAALLRERLSGNRIGASEALSLGDPSLLPSRLDDADATHLSARFGPDFAAAVAALAPNEWSSPIPSVFGLHVVFLLARRDAEPLTLAGVRERVLSDYRHDHRRELLLARLRALRSGYRFEVRRLRS